MSNLAKPVYVLGTGLSHDGSACLLKDGRICVAIEKERLTRRKHDGFSDGEAIQYCLDTEGIGLSDIAVIVQNANFGMFEFGNDWYWGKRLLTNDMPVFTISHHLAHAYSAFGTCRFEKAAILIIDGCGSGLDECIDLGAASIPELPDGEIKALWFEKDSYYSTSGNEIVPLYKDFSPFGMGIKGYPLYPRTTRHSIGGLYGAVSHYVFGGMDDSGKLMGLAPYGRPDRYKFDVFELKDDRVFVKYDWMSQFRMPCRSEQDFQSRFQEYADLAYWIQKEVERALLYVAHARYKLFPAEKLCYAGGVALNAVANRRILSETPFQQMYIQPAAGDNGLAIGCAYYGWLKILGKDRVCHDGKARFGRRYPDAQVEVALDKYARMISVKESVDIDGDTADALKNGNVVGWFQGGSEFGPRALGARSILADPRVPGIAKYINSQVKYREEFRPFAPAVRSEDAPEYFEPTCESPYMLMVAQVRSQWRERLSSVVHVDGSARLQTVSMDLAPEFYQLLCAVDKQMGVGVLLNTSFNKRRMPIVETPADAVTFFLASGIHVLAIGKYIVTKQSGSVIPDQSDAQLQGPKGLLECLRRNMGPVAGTFQFTITEDLTFTLENPNGSPILKDGLATTQPVATLEAGARVFAEIVSNPLRLQHHLGSGSARTSGDTNRLVDLLTRFR